jgi:hypothetical protein
MRRTSYGVVAAMAAGLWLLSAGLASAQTLRVRAGDTVWMTETSGALSRGVVLGVEPSAVRVAIDGREQRRELGTLREMWRDGDSLSNGIKWGALSGLGAGLAFGGALVAVYGNEGGDVAGPLVGILGLTVGGGVAIGAGIDALVHGRTLVYRASPSKVTLLPSVTGRSRGLLMSVRF